MVYDERVSLPPVAAVIALVCLLHRFAIKMLIPGFQPLLKNTAGFPGKKGNYHCIMKVVVCIGSSCHLKGSHQVVSCIKKLIEKYNLEDRIELSGTFCMGNCQNRCLCSVDGEIFSVVPKKRQAFLRIIFLKKYRIDLQKRK